MDIESCDKVIIKDDGGEDVAEERSSELKAEAHPRGDRQPCVADTVGGPVGARLVHRGQSNVPHITQQPGYRWIIIVLKAMQCVPRPTCRI